MRTLTRRSITLALARAMLGGAILVGCGSEASPVASPIPSPIASLVASPTSGPASAPTALDANVEIGAGRTLHVTCVGPIDSGRPTVIFEPGLGVDYATWNAQMAALLSTDRACAYDRAGVGYSAAVDAPRTTQDQVDDLRALFEKIGVTGPVVLVGHSIAGFNLLLYTDAYPDQVVGAVLVDIRPPSLTARLLAELPAEAPDDSDALQAIRELLTTFHTDDTMNAERLLLDESIDQVLAAPGFGDRPVDILWSARVAEQWAGLDADLAARLTAAVEAARTETEDLADDPAVSVIDAGHFIHVEQATAVNDAIRRILDQFEP